MSKNTIGKDQSEFIKENNLGSMYYTEYITYATLVESRITNNLMLISNPTLCRQLGLNCKDLFEELQSLIPIREKLSFDSENKQRGR